MRYLTACLLMFAFFAVASCMKTDSGCSNVDPKSELDTLIKSAQMHGMNYSVHPTGIVYEIVDPGYNESPNPNSVITFYYTGKFLNDVIFDQSGGMPSTAALYQLIEGWKIALPLIRKTGKIRLLIPSALAYGCNGSAGAVPPNTPLFFEVHLINVQ